MDYCHFAEFVHSLIDDELKKVESKEADLPEAYAKLVVCGEFFRYIRGEFFHSSRPYGLDCQTMMYQWEDQLLDRIRKLREQLDTTDSKTVHFLDLSKKLFD